MFAFSAQLNSRPVVWSLLPPFLFVLKERGVLQNLVNDGAFSKMITYPYSQPVTNGNSQGTLPQETECLRASRSSWGKCHIFSRADGYLTIYSCSQSQGDTDVVTLPGVNTPRDMWLTHCSFRDMMGCSSHPATQQSIDRTMTTNTKASDFPRGLTFTIPPRSRTVNGTGCRVTFLSLVRGLSAQKTTNKI